MASATPSMFERRAVYDFSPVSFFFLGLLLLFIFNSCTLPVSLLFARLLCRLPLLFSPYARSPSVHLSELSLPFARSQLHPSTSVFAPLRSSICFTRTSLRHSVPKVLMNRRMPPPQALLWLCASSEGPDSTPFQRRAWTPWLGCCFFWLHSPPWRRRG
jgi:hypothetical protein